MALSLSIPKSFFAFVRYRVPAILKDVRDDEHISPHSSNDALGCGRKQGFLYNHQDGPAWFHEALMGDLAGETAGTAETRF